MDQVEPQLTIFLTPKEFEVLGYIGRGLTNPEIAKQMYITTGTVKCHCKTLYIKLGLDDKSLSSRITAAFISQAFGLSPRLEFSYQIKVESRSGKHTR